MIKISVIIPMYNVAHYLVKCVNSVLNQDFEQGCFEIIMVNDGSPDNSLDVANNLAKKYAFIKVVSQKNKGLGGARNTGITNALGKYIVFLDADDWLMKNSIIPLIKILDEKQLDILEFGANFVSEKGGILSCLSTNSNQIVYNGIDYYNALKYSGSACNKVYRKDFLINNELFFLEKIYGEDFEFNTRAFFFAKKVFAVNNICASFLQSSDSITRNNDKEKKDKYLNDFVIILSSIATFRTNNSQNQNTKAEASFFNERLTMVNINAFYQMFKNNYSYLEISNYRKKLESKKLLYVKHPVSIKKKELFRKIMLNNFFLFRITQTLKRISN